MLPPPPAGGGAYEYEALVKGRRPLLARREK